MSKMYSKSGLLVEAFIKTVDCKQTGLYILTNKVGNEVLIINNEAKIVSLMRHYKNGTLQNTVFGHPNINDYFVLEYPYLGTMHDRITNQIVNGLFFVNGQEYKK